MARMMWPGGEKLAELARLADLLEHVLEEIALGVGVRLIEPELVHLVDHLGQDGELVDGETRAVHEVDGGALGDLGVEREHLVADEAHEVLAREPLGPGGPAEAIAGDRRRATEGRGVERVLEFPAAREQALVGLSPDARPCLVLGVEGLDEVEEE
jgi:hypothetical protein